MLLQRMLTNADAQTCARISRFSGVECLPLDGAAGPGSVVVLARPRDARLLSGTLSSVAAAASLGVPVVVIAGAKDEAGEALFREARLCGVPPECILFVEDGKVVDAAGSAAGEALRGKGIGVGVVVRAAERALKENLVPEPAFWEESEEDSAEPVFWETPREDGTQEDAAEKSSDGTGGPAEPPEGPSKPDPVGVFFDSARASVAVFGIKGNVGATTVAACLAGVLEDYDPLFLEVSPSPVGHRYFAEKPDRYACISRDGISGSGPRPCGILVADIAFNTQWGQGGAVDTAYQKAGCVVLVTDGSPVSFERVGNWVKGGWRLDVLVVNRTLSGAGYPPEVYAGEYGIQKVVGVPGGYEEEATVNQALQSGRLPLGKSPDFDGAIGLLARMVLEKLERGAVQ